MIDDLLTLRPGALENWLVPATAVLSIFALVKKVFWPKTPEANPTAFKPELAHIHDKIDARFLTTIEKLDHLGTTIHDRLAKLESAVARLDERTRNT